MARALIALLLLALCALPARALTPAESRDLAFAQHPGARLDPATLLIDEAGAPVRLAGVMAERPTVLVLDYLHCPNLCGLVLAGLADALAEVPLAAGRDYRVLALSIDPAEGPADAAAARAQYAARYPHEIGGWHFLTGAPAAVSAIAESVGFPYRWEAELGQFAHPAGLVLLAPDGTVSRYLLGVAPSPLDLRLGLTEASAGRIAAPASHLLLLCFGYDPVAGKYDLQVMRVTRVLGLLVLGALLALVARLLRAERRRS
jgi:protein SCO1/2